MRRETADRSNHRAGWRGLDPWLAAIVVFGLLLRLYRLGAQSIWIDEAMTLTWVDEIRTRGWASMLQNIHGPLHTTAVVLMDRLAATEWAWRLPSALAGTLAIVTLADLARRVAGRHLARLAGALMAVSPFALYYSQETRGYAFTLAFASLAASAAWRLAAAPSMRRAVLFLGAELLAVGSNLNGIFLALGLNVWLATRLLPRGRRAWSAWVGVHGIVVLLALPYATQIQRQVRVERLVGVETDFGQEAPLRGATTMHVMALPYAAYAFAAGYSLGPSLAELRADPASFAQPRSLLWVVLVGLGFGVPLMVGVVRAGVPGLRGFLGIPAAVVTAMVIWLALTNMKPFNVRYLSVLQPFFLLFVGLGLLRMRHRWRWVLGSIVFGTSMLSCWNALHVPRYARDDVRGALAYVRAHAAPGDLVLHLNLISPLQVYDALEPVVMHARPGSGDSPEAARAYVEPLRRQYPVIWYLECRPESGDPHGFLLGALRDGARRSEERVFPGVRVLRFVYADPGAPPPVEGATPPPGAPEGSE